MRSLDAAVALLAVIAPVFADTAYHGGLPDTQYNQGIPAALQNVGIDQKLNEQIPLDLTFKDEQGRTVRLGDYFGKRPVVLSLVYYQCPMLCNMVLNGQVKVFRVLPYNVGKEFEVVTVSFDPHDTPQMAAAKQRTYLAAYRRPASNPYWHFLTGDQDNITKLAKAVGFRYYWDAAHQQFAHASGILVSTPQGKISQYLFGVEYPAEPLRLSIVAASNKRIGSRTDQVLLFCFHYDAAMGRYTLLIRNVLKLAAFATLVVLLGGIALFLWREHRHPRMVNA